MKKIEDYLHFYLGCKVEYGYEGKRKIGQLTGKVELYGWEVFDAGAAFDIYHKVSTELIKPILRQLSDMTEDETKELIHIVFVDTLTVVEKDGFKYYATPKRVLYLLSKQFDIFGLIEAGLAIDRGIKNIER